MSQKKKPQKQPQLSPENYIRQRSRNLPIYECRINRQWEDGGGLANIVIARRHTSGNITVCMYMVDLYCLGTKNTYFRFNVNESEYHDLLDEMSDRNLDMITADYNLVHNIIFAANEFAAEYGFEPHNDFTKITQYFLEEDDDNIPLIEIACGKDNKPLYINSGYEDKWKQSQIIAQLEKKAGNGNFEIMINADTDYDDDEDYDEDYDEEEGNNKEFIGGMKKQFPDIFKDLTKEQMLENLDNMQKKFAKSRSLPHTEYAYQYPEYPKELQLTHSELHCLFLPENNDYLSVETIKQILALPRETLINDLCHSILYAIGQYLADGKVVHDNVYGTITHCLLLLGELRATESLDAVLEMMRQNEDFSDYFFGDSAGQFIVISLYYIAGNQLPMLLSYVKEPNLNTFLKCYIFDVISLVAKNQPDKRAEIIEWYRDFLNFLYEKHSDTAFFDANLAGMMMNGLMDIRAEELLPEVKKLFDTGLVDEMCAGNYEDVEKGIIHPKHEPYYHFKLQNIYERYDEWKKILNK